VVGASLPLAMRTPFGIKVFRYSLAGIVALIVGTALLVGFDGFLRIGAVVSSSLATGIAAIPN
jgi:putative flippase GtrA